MYPLDYAAEIDAASREFSLEPSLIRGVIRTESGYDPRAQSGAGAEGLMQLMPATARSVALMLGEPALADDLYSPAANIRLGAAYLRYLLGKYELADALAAYNAGEGNLLRWRAEGRAEYGFAETRAYVNKVLRSRNVYKILRKS